VVEPVADHRSAWWVLAELGRRLGFELADTSRAGPTDDAMLAGVAMGSRVPFEQLVETGWAGGPAMNSRRDGSTNMSSAWVGGGSRPDFWSSSWPPCRRPRRWSSCRADNVISSTPVVVYSVNGELTGIAKVDASIRRGAVSIPQGHPHAAKVNRLTGKDDIDRVTGMAHYSGVPVRVTPA
jgi:anaerobic selenocysteine-containing dehydrogenase